MKTIYEEREFKVIDYGDNLYELKGYFKQTYQYLQAINVYKQTHRFRFKPVFRVGEQCAIVKGEFR